MVHTAIVADRNGCNYRLCSVVKVAQLKYFVTEAELAIPNQKRVKINNKINNNTANTSLLNCSYVLTSN